MSGKNLGKVWKNEKKTLEKHPDIRGYIYINGVKHDLGGWSRVDDEGRSYYSLSARQYEQQGEAPDDGVKRFTRSDIGSAHDLNDSIPF